jgi:hypothetical protein
MKFYSYTQFQVLISSESLLQVRDGHTHERYN